jgi:hypothetical protein
MVFWTYHHVAEIEKSTRVKTAQNSDVRHDRMRHNTSTREAAHAYQHAHMFSSPKWVDPTRPMHMTRIMMTSSWHQHALLTRHVYDQLASDGVFIWWLYLIEFCVVCTCFSSIVFIFIIFNLIIKSTLFIVYFASIFYKSSCIKDRQNVII